MLRKGSGSEKSWEECEMLLRGGIEAGGKEPHFVMTFPGFALFLPIKGSSAHSFNSASLVIYPQGRTQKLVTGRKSRRKCEGLVRGTI
jgi:hypothetical protein